MLAGAAFAAAMGASVVGLYVVHPAVQGHRLPIGPDGPVYTWLARLAAAEGFADAPGAGPGVPGLTLALGRLLGAEPVDVVMLLGVLLPAVAGLAGGAVLEASLGHDRRRTAAGVLLTAAFAAYLAGGWLANLTMVAIFLAAVSLLVASGGARMWPSAVLLLSAGLAHRLFGVAGAAILLAAAAVHAFVGRARRRPDDERAALRIAGAAAAGQGAALLTAAWLAAGPPVPGDTSQDGFFRRTGLRSLLIDRYRERFLGESARAAIPIATGVALGSRWIAKPDEPSAPARLLRHLVWAWGAVTLVGVVGLAATGWGPPYRVLQFAFFIPLAAAAGASSIARRSRAHAVFAWIAVVAFVAVSLIGWFRQSPAFTPSEAAAVARAGAAISSLPPDVPVVVLVDTEEPAAAYHVTRAWNLLRTGVPPGRIRDVRVAVGHPRDLLAALPGHTGDPEHDRIADVYLREVRPLLAEAAILVLRELSPAGFEAARGLEHAVVVADGVVALTRGDEIEAAAGVGAPDGLGPIELLLLVLLGLFALGALGWGWAAWTLPEAAGPTAVALAAPSVGAAVAILSAVAADRVGLALAGPGPLVLAAAVGLAGLVLARR